MQTMPEKWGTEEVCQWLELVGLSSFKQAFKKKNIDGCTLLHMDGKLFGKWFTCHLYLVLYFSLPPTANNQHTYNSVPVVLLVI